MRRLWGYVKWKVGLGVPAPVIVQSPAKPPTAVPDKTLADAWVRISERRYKKAVTADTLAQAQALLADSRGDAAERLLLRVVTSTATIYHVRAADVLRAQAGKMRDVPLCDQAGGLILSGKSARRSIALLADVLDGAVELLPLPAAAIPDSNSVFPTTDNGIKSAELSAEAIKYELPPEADAEAISPREHPP